MRYKYYVLFHSQLFVTFVQWAICSIIVEKSPFIKVHRVTDPFVKSVFTVVEMVFASLVDGKLRLIMFLSQSVNSSLVLGLSAVVGCSSLLSHVKPLAKWMVPISASQWPSCAQQASLFMHGHGRAAFPFLLLILLSVIPANSGPPMPYFSRYKRPSILIPP